MPISVSADQLNKDESPLRALPSAARSVVDRLGRAFGDGGEELALVGGIVRDMLAGGDLPGDLDFATGAAAERTRALGLAAGAASVYDVGERFGTIGFVFEADAGGGGDPAVNAEITSYRSEHYPDATRRPAVTLGGTLAEDLSRRDFTVNAMALDPATGALTDPFDGQSDLARGILRAVGDPDARFREDPLRLLRAARFVAQLGLRVEDGTRLAMGRQAATLGRVSRERVYAELTKLLTGAYASHGLDTLLATGLLPEAIPELALLARDADAIKGPHREKDLWEHITRVVDQTPRRPAVRWAALLHDAAKPRTRSVDGSGEVHFIGHEREGADLARKALARLKADKGTQAAVTRLVELHFRPAAYEPGWTDSAVRRLMLDAEGVLDDLLDLAAADVTSAREQKRRAAAERIAGLRAHITRVEAEHALAELRSPLDGEELMRYFGRPPGRWIAAVKDRLREMVIDGELEVDDKAGAERIARAMIERDGV